MRRRPTTTAGAAVALAALAACAPAAHAAFGMPQLVSVSPLEQSDGITSSALSADGRHLVFAGSIGGLKGVLRRDLATGAVEPVAAGDAYNPVAVDDARDPSVSADGRYVSFTTTAALAPGQDTNNASDVYVRDMDASVPAAGAPCEPTGPCAYTLASARDGVAQGIAYAAGGGASAIGRQAITADGRHVAFSVSGESDLAGAGTPGGQIAVRDLDTLRTTLVSVERDPASGAMTGSAVAGGSLAGDGAAISADGTTVVWSGTHVARQARTIDGDPATVADHYNEPLWRRIADGPSAPIRRVAGPADPDAPGCPPGGSMADPACQGPFPQLYIFDSTTSDIWGGWLPRGGGVPSVSADGRAVAFLGAPVIPPKNTFNDATDVFVVDMRDGLSRRAAVQRLTLDLTRDPLSFVSDLAIAPDGRRIAFATDRLTFPLSPPFLISTPPAQPGVQELWLIDRDGQTLQRVSRTVDGGPSASPVGRPRFQADPESPSFDATGTMVAFDSPAPNLVAVDHNDATDAFLVRDTPVPPGTPGRTDISSPPAPLAIPRAWRMALRGVGQKDGTVRLDATVPGAGVLRATVTATVPVVKHVKVKRRGGGHRTVRKTVLSKRRVATASTVVRANGLTRLTVRVTKIYKSLVQAKAGLDATAQVTFAAAKHATLRDTLDVRFRVVKAKPKAKAKAQPKATTKTKTTTKSRKSSR